MTMKQKLNTYIGMTKRNILMFFKDKSTLFFSMLAPLIVFGLYIVFLKDTYLSGIKNSLEAVKDFIDMKDVENIANTWLLAGILGTSTITVSLNSLQVMVSDKEKKIDYDYNSTPAYGPLVVLAYFTGAFINTFLIAGGILTIGLVVLSSVGNLYLSASSIALLYLVTALGCASSTIIMMVVVSFFKKSSALGAFSGIVSAAVGFIIGAYIPLGNFDKIVQSVLTLVPGSHIAALYRNLLMSGVANHVADAMGTMGGAEFLTSVKEEFAFQLTLFTYKTTIPFMYIYSVGSIVLAFVINFILYKKASKRA